MRRPLRMQFLLTATGGLLCLALVQTASAQSQSRFGNRGPATQIGSNAAGTPVGGNFGTGRVTSAPAGGIGGTMGVTGPPVSGGLGANLLGGTTAAGAGTQGTFVGRDDTAGRFVGDQRVGQQTGGARRTAVGGARQLGNRGGGGATGQLFGDDDSARGPGAQRTQRIVRPRQEIAFSYPQRSTTTISASLNGRIERIALRQPALRNVDVLVNEQGIATLRGRVDSEEIKKLAAIMARIEPGVRSIENELTVGPASSN
jgi:hypothetical protein